MKIYLVTSGSYSDYRIEAVFSTYDLAEKYKHEFGLRNDIEEFELDGGAKDISQKIMDGWLFWRIALDLKDGNYISHFSNSSSPRYSKEDEIEISEEYNPMYKGWMESLTFESSKLPKLIRVFHIYVWAKTEEEAVKIAAEKRAQWINDCEANYCRI